MALPIFPDLPSMEWNNKKKPNWNVTVKKSGTGKRKSMTTQAYTHWELTMSFRCLDQAQIEKAAGFFSMIKGPLTPFLWKDMDDYKQEKVRIGAGNGENKEFQLLRNLGGYYVEPILDIIPGTLTVYADNTPIAVSSETDGWTVLATAPPMGSIVTATFEYYWRVAIAGDCPAWENFWYGFYKLNSFTLETVR